MPGDYISEEENPEIPGVRFHMLLKYNLWSKESPENIFKRDENPEIPGVWFHTLRKYNLRGRKYFLPPESRPTLYACEQLYSIILYIGTH